MAIVRKVAVQGDAESYLPAYILKATRVPQASSKDVHEGQSFRKGKY